MRAIEVTTWGETPVFNPSATSPPAPTNSDQVQVRVLAAGLHHLVRSQAAGKHYSTNPSKTPVPYIPGSDGVGVTSDGQVVLFSSIGTGGAFADLIVLPRSALIPIPDAPSLKFTGDDTLRETAAIKLATRVAALFNPAMSSWMALQTRATPSILQQKGGFNLLIIGATSLSGQLAIKLARHLGARTIIGLARNAEAMRNQDIDIAVTIEDDISSTAIAPVLFNPATKPDIILDYLYGPLTSHVLASLPGGLGHPDLDTPVEYINIGTLLDAEISLPGAMLRSKNITLRGAGLGSWSVSRDGPVWFPALLELLSDEQIFDLEQFDVIMERQFEDADAAWADIKKRTVFTNRTPQVLT